MAFVIKQQPFTSGYFLHETGYENIYEVFDTNYSVYKDFKYIYEIYDVNGLISRNYVAPTKFNGFGFINYNSILKQQFKNNFNPSPVNLFKDCEGSIVEYGVKSTNYSNGTTGSTLTFRKCLAINSNDENFNPTDYILQGLTNKALSKKDNYNFTKLKLTDEATLRFLNGRINFNSSTYDSRIYELLLTIYRKNGVVDIYTSFYNNPYWGSVFQSSTITQLRNVKNFILEAGVGPKNIMETTWNWLWSDSVNKLGQLVNISFLNGDKYVINAYSWPFGTNGKTSQDYKYEVICDYKGKKSINLGWKNELGGYDYYNFNLEMSRSIEKEDITYNKRKYNPAIESGIMSKNQYSRVETIVSQDINDVYIINTDYMKKGEELYFEDLWVSADVYAQIDGVWTPIIINNNDVLIETTKNGLLQYQVSFRKSNKRNKVR
jgi:hypothetical protein